MLIMFRNNAWTNAIKMQICTILIPFMFKPGNIHIFTGENPDLPIMDNCDCWLNTHAH